MHAERHGYARKAFFFAAPDAAASGQHAHNVPLAGKALELLRDRLKQGLVASALALGPRRRLAHGRSRGTHKLGHGSSTQRQNTKARQLDGSSCGGFVPCRQRSGSSRVLWRALRARPLSNSFPSGRRSAAVFSPSCSLSTHEMCVFPLPSCTVGGGPRRHPSQVRVCQLPRGVF